MLIPPGTTVSTDTIDWQEAAYIASGCCGVVYEVLPGIVAKIAPCILPQEVSIQATLAQEGLALPVFAFAHGVWIPSTLRHAACGPHGLRCFPSDASCTCHAPVDVLLMPRVERICTDDELQKPELIILLDRVSSRFWHLSHRLWDCHSGNVGFFDGRFVALDFGNCSDTLHT